MGKAWQLLVNARGDSSDGQRAMRDLQRAGRRLSSAVGVDFGRIAKLSGIALGAGLAATVKIGVDELKESAAVTAQTVAGLKSTHGAANVTKTSILNLAQAISLKSGIDDEAVQAGQNLLLTFTNIRNEAGRGNKIFDRTTQAVADMATKMNNGFVPSSEQMQKASILMGKALNDPVKGISALSRVGVSFTQGQKDQIKALVESGDKLGAQKLILAELNKEFGGAATAAGKTAPGAIARAKNAFAELAASLTSAVMPSIAGVAEGALRLIKNVQAWTKTSAGKDALEQARGVVEALGTAIGIAAKAAGTIVKVLYNFRDILIPMAATIIAYRATVRAVTIATEAWAVAQAAWNVLMNLNPIGIVAAAVIGLGVALVVAYRKSETFRNIVDSVWAVLKKVWSVLMDHKVALLGLLGPMGLFAAALITAYKHSETFRNVVNGAFDAVRGAVSATMGAISAAVGATLATVGSIWSAHGTQIKTVVSGAWSMVRGLITTNLAIVKGAVQVAMAVIRGDWSGAWTAIKTATSTALVGIKTTISGYATILRTTMDAVWSSLKAAVPGAWSEIKSAITSAARGVAGAIESGIGSLANVVATMKSKGLAIAKAIADGIVEGLRNSVSRVVDAATSLADHIPARLRKLLDINSPSRVTTTIGEQVGDGLARGIESKTKDVETAAEKIVKRMTAKLEGWRSSFDLTMSTLDLKSALTGDKDTSVLQQQINAKGNRYQQLKNLLATSKKLTKDQRAQYTSEMASIIRDNQSIAAQITELGGAATLPTYARGGVATGPSVFGEAGKEAAIPLGSGPRATMDRERVLAQTGLAASAPVIHVYPSPGMDEELLVRKVIRRLRTAGATA